MSDGFDFNKFAQAATAPAAAEAPTGNSLLAMLQGSGGGPTSSSGGGDDKPVVGFADLLKRQLSGAAVMEAEKPSASPVVEESHADERLSRFVNLGDGKNVTYSPGAATYTEQTPITQFVYNYDYYNGRLIAVNENFIVYVINGPPKSFNNPGNGSIMRVLSKKSEARTLLKKHTGTIVDVSFASENSNMLASVSQDGALIVWSLELSEDQTTISEDIELEVNHGGENAYFSLVTFHPTNEDCFVTVDTENEVSLWDSAESIVVATLREKVTSVCFSGDGTKVIIGAENGDVRVFAVSSISSKLVTQFPAHLSSIHSVLSFGRAVNSNVSPQAGSDELFVTTDENGREFKLWTLEGKLLQTVQFGGDFVRSMRTNIEVDPKSRHLIICDTSMNNEISGPVIHLFTLENGPSGFRFARGCSHSAPNGPILSFNVAHSDNPSIAFDLFAIQSEAIQLYHIEGGESSGAGGAVSAPATAAAKNVRISPTPASKPATAPVSQPAAPEKAAPSRDKKSGKVSPAPTAAPAVSILKKKEEERPASAPATASTSSSGTVESDVDKAAKEERRRKREEAARKEGSSSTSEERTYSVASGVDWKRIENGLLSKVDQLLKHILARSEKDRMAREESLATLVAKKVSESMQPKIEDIVRREVATALEPLLETSLKPIRASQKELAQTVVKSTKAIEASVGQNLAESIKGLGNGSVPNGGSADSASLKEPAVEAFRSCFQDQVLPGFEASCQKMFSQISSTFDKGLQERFKDPINDHMQELRRDVQRIDQKRNDGVHDAVRAMAEASSKFASAMEEMKACSERLNSIASGQALPAAAAQSDDLFPKIKELIEEEEYQDAFMQALSATDIDLVVKTLGLVDAATVFSQPPKVENTIVVALIQQLGVMLEVDTTLKLEWLQEAILALNPKDEQIQGHLEAVLAGLEEKVVELMQDKVGQSNNATALKIVLRIVQSLK